VTFNPAGLPLEAGRHCFWLCGRVTVFPGLRWGQANPRMLAWEWDDSQITRTSCFSMILGDDAIGDSTNKVTHFFSSCTPCACRHHKRIQHATSTSTGREGCRQPRRSMA
jgi:hypothetical protein